MTNSFYSPSWYRVAKLKPRLRGHAELHRHHYRGELWYVLQDHSSGRVHRFTPEAYLLLGLMNGRRTVQEIWDVGRARLGDDAPSQEEMIRLLSQLHAVDLMHCDVPPDTEELLERFEKRQYGRLKQNLTNPFAVRIPLLDPDRFLARLRPAVRPAFGWVGALVWGAVVGAAVFLAALHWPELTQDVTDRVLAPGNLVLLWLTFPVVKAFHEFGHAFAVKVWGGEVHEMGILFLVFTPIPYVDASSASAFREKRRRVVVGAAGMAAELLLASLALFFWVNAEPGTARAVAYNAILIAGVSTVVFNGNPLLRYDGYYILSDLVEIPNLAPRGVRYLGYLVQRYALGVRNLEAPVATRGERAWFVGYTFAAFAYRLFVYASIILFVASRFFVVGMLLAAWGVVGLVILPLGRALSALVTHPAVRDKRVRAAALALAVAAAGGAALFAAPFPLRTRAEGVVWVPEQAVVRAGADGVVERLLAHPGARVRAGDPLVACSDPFLPAQVRLLEARLAELQALYDGQILEDRVQAEITREEMEAVGAELGRSRQRLAELTVRSPADGVFVVPGATDLPGRFLHQGEQVGYVLDRSQVVLRVVVPQEQVDRVRTRTEAAAVRFAGRLGQTVPAAVRREVPGATDRLPSLALGRAGGGEIAVDPRDAGGDRAFRKVFEFDLVPEAPLERLPLSGERVYVRFDHGREPLGVQWFRALRRLFLRRFHV
ncbi:MAG: hemolysin D [Deferrisomatales bacterium]